MSKILLSIILIIFSLITIYGARPLSTDDAGVVEKNICEIELGFNISKFVNNLTEQSIDYSLKYGITDRMDIGIAFSDQIKDTLYLSPVEISIKMFLYQSESFLPDIAFSIAAVPGDYPYFLNFIVSKQIKNFVFHSNLGYSVDPITANNAIAYSLAMEFILNEKINIVSEIYSESINSFTGQEPLNYLIGINYLLKQGITVDLGFTSDINRIETKYAIVSGFTFAF